MNFGNAETLESIEAAIRQHKALLQQHNATLDRLRRMIQAAGQNVVRLDVCIDQTNKLTQNFEEVVATYNSNLTSKPSPETGIPDRKKHSNPTASVQTTHAEPVIDPSGLFAVDSVPTPVTQLLQGNKAKEKAAGQQPTRKGKKRSISGQTVEAVTLPNGNDQMGTPAKRLKLTETNDKDVKDDTDADDSFIKLVETEHTAKEEARQKKKNKKRKRESDGSTAEATQNAAGVNGQNSNAGKPPNKKQKKKNKQKYLPKAEKRALIEAQQQAKRERIAKKQKK